MKEAARSRSLTWVFAALVVLSASVTVVQPTISLLALFAVGMAEALVLQATQADFLRALRSLQPHVVAWYGLDTPRLLGPDLRPIRAAREQRVLATPGLSEIASTYITRTWLLTGTLLVLTLVLVVGVSAG